jgi:hypothetical protein
MITRCSFLGDPAAGAGTRPLTSISCRRQRMREDIPPLPQYAFLAWCSVKKSTGTNLTLLLRERNQREDRENYISYYYLLTYLLAYLLHGA